MIPEFPESYQLPEYYNFRHQDLCKPVQCPSAGLSDLYITTVDATAENMSAIRDGKVAIGVSQDPYKMGYTAVEQAIKWYQGEETEEFIEVPVEYMDKDNIQDFIDREKGYGVEVE